MRAEGDWAEGGGPSRRCLDLVNLRLKGLLGPVTRVKKKKNTFPALPGPGALGALFADICADARAVASRGLQAPMREKGADLPPSGAWTRRSWSHFRKALGAIGKEKGADLPRSGASPWTRRAAGPSRRSSPAVSPACRAPGVRSSVLGFRPLGFEGFGFQVLGSRV